MKNSTAKSSQHAPPRYFSKFTWQKQALAFTLSFLMFFTSVPTELFSGGFFNFDDDFTGRIAHLEQAQARESRQRNRGSRQYQQVPADFSFTENSSSKFADLELIYISKDSNVYYSPETGEEIEEVKF